MEMEYEQSRREFFRHSLFGGSSTDVVEHEVYTIHLSDINNSYRCEFEALGQPLICGSIPSVCPRSLLEGSEELDVSDLMRDRIEVLIGADIAGRLLTDDQRRISSGLVAIRTKLGWTVMGKIPPTEVRDDISSLCVTTLLSLDLENLWKLDAIGVSDAEVEKKTQSLQAEMEEHFAHTTTRDIEGRYEVALPWVQDKERIPSNKDLAENQLRSVRRKLEEVGDMKEYGQIFEEWMKQGIIEYAREDKLDGVHYLPHRPVYKRNSQTSRIRPVFNASARKRDKAPEHLKITAEQLKSSFYVDNCLSSFQNVEETEKFVKESTELLSTACFNLRDWDSYVEKTTLHIFCDASQFAYATCIFLRIEKEDRVDIQLIQARTRVAPLKKLTIPRLELLACLIGARLAANVIQDLEFEEIPRFYWTDSTNALCWIQREDNWAAFVKNRVKEIHNLSSPESWRHIPGRLNPADLPSRGCSAESLKETRWWEGPAWLKVSQEEWPKSTIIPDLEIVYSERRKTILNTLCTTRENENLFGRYSHFLRIVRITAWIYRFFNNAKIDRRKIISEDLSTEEITKSEIILIRLIQRESFSGHEDKKLQGFKLLVDSSGILRIKTKICRREDFANFRMPILLPSDHFLVSLLIRWNHETHGHAGLQTLLGILRENYWILRSRKTVKKIINQCIRCKRFTATPATVESTSLPEDRVRDAAVFKIVGVDLTGHLILKNKKKAWIVIFTCAVYRGVHLELVTSLSMEAFLQAFRRFIARRGRPLIVYSDNGTNFKGMANALKKIDFSRLKCDPSLKNITWKFIPPGAPWWGGWWERLIGMMKQLLFRILGQTSLGYEELSTVMCDVESLMNTRPLTYLTEESEDLVPLTPSLFLHEVREVGVPDLDLIDNQTLSRKYQYIKRVREDLRERFRIEYFGFLRQETRRLKTTIPFKVGDMVLIGQESLKRLHWPLARIIQLYPGKDGLVRVAKVKTSSGDKIRPIQKLYNLEITPEIRCRDPLMERSPTQEVRLTTEEDPLTSQQEQHHIATPNVVSSYGRPIKRPNRLDLLNFSFPCLSRRDANSKRVDRMDEKNETQDAEEYTAEGDNNPATTSDRVTHRTEIEVQSFDATYPAAQFFRTYDQKTDWDGLTNTEKVLRLPRYLNNKPLEHFRRLRMETQHYIQVRQTFLDLYPETNEATYAQYFSMKLAGQPNLEEYYRNKTALGLQLGLPQEVILETLTEGLPPSDQRLVRIVPPENLGAWFRLVQRIRGSGAPSPRHPDEHAPPLLGPYAPVRPSPRTVPTRSTPPTDCRFCGGLHWHSECRLRQAPQLPRASGDARAARSAQLAEQRPASPAPSPSVTRTSHWDNQGSPRPAASSPVTLVTKRDKTKRFCIDYRKVNEVISSDVHPLPRIEDILDRLARAKYFSTADVSSAYWQVPIHPDSRPLLAFATIDGLYQPTRLPFGLKTSPQIYERAINQVLQGHGLDCVAHYFDDFVIYSETLEEHQEHLRKFFAFCDAENLQLNLTKCEFFRQTIEFLGYTITAGTTTPLIRNTDVIHAIPPPNNRKTLQSFLGAVNVYNKFIPDYARLRTPLNNLLKKDVTWDWDDKCQKAFTSLKESLTQHPVLHLYKDELPCQVYCDASTLGIAGVLKQVHSAGKAYPVQYFSRALRVHERNYTISELECLAIVESVEKFRVYLMGRKFTIFSDHHALQWLKTIKNPSGRLFRWSLRLSCYEYEVRYIKGSLQHEADLLSRNPFCGFLDATIIKNHQLTPSGESKLTIDRNGLQTLKRRGVTKIVVPDALVPDLLTKVHNRYNHPGISQMTRLISTQYYWKGMSEDISKTTKACAICQSTKPPRGPTFGELGQLPVATQPFDLVALDTIAGLAKYGNAKTYLHVVVDHFSRYTWTFPSKSTSITTYQQVIKRVLQDGSPKRLLTDRAPAFTSPKFRKFLINRNIQPLLTTSNNPQANGLCERLNATLTGKLRLLHLENPKAAWTKLAKRVTVVYNNTPHSVTGFPPGYLMFGVLPPELTEHVNPYPVLTTARRIAHERTQAKHLKDKHAYDQQHKTPHFEPGDLVLVKVYHHPNTGKLAPYFTGPYEILEIISPNVVRINRPNQPLNRNTDTVHVNKLQYYNENIRYIAPPTLIPHPAKPQSRTLPPLFEHLTPDLFTVERFAPTIGNCTTTTPVDPQCNIIAQRDIPQPAISRPTHITKVKTPIPTVRADPKPIPLQARFFRNVKTFPLFHLLYLINLFILPTVLLPMATLLYVSVYTLQPNRLFQLQEALFEITIAVVELIQRATGIILPELWTILVHSHALVALIGEIIGEIFQTLFRARQIE
ncbi:hypothetical protein LAZ67_X003634 [Cordylochernes scorpioides]|uniref:RNA-directed DNA polymerase n=1 Tax=Cordylochernes scorpioides TaxID=51811 RepID=A0ABY6LU96_9ARAC|nr:hypothetical protein LAZ67_X003634 [Cordylochernes scorpioides]